MRNIFKEVNVFSKTLYLEPYEGAPEHVYSHIAYELYLDSVTNVSFCNVDSNMNNSVRLDFRVYGKERVL